MLFTGISTMMPGARSVGNRSDVPFARLLSVIDIVENRVSEDEPTSVPGKLCDTIMAVRMILQQSDTEPQQPNATLTLQWTSSYDFQHW